MVNVDEENTLLREARDMQKMSKKTVKFFCCDDPKRACERSCAAYAIMAIPRTRLVYDDTMGTYNVIADRDPFLGPFCKKHQFPIGLNADECTIAPRAEKDVEEERWR